MGWGIREPAAWLQLGFWALNTAPPKPIKDVSILIAAEDAALPRESMEPTGLLPAILQVTLLFPSRTQVDSYAFLLGRDI